MGGLLPLKAGCFHTLRPHNCVQTPFKRNVVHCIIVSFSDRVLAGESLHQDFESFVHKSGCCNLVCVFSLAFLPSER